MSTVDAINAGRSAFADLAARRGQKLTSIPLKDNSMAKILSNDNSFDVYFVKKGDKHPNVQMFSGSPEKIQEIAKNFLENLQKMAAEGIDVMKEWSKSFQKPKA